MNLKDFYPEPTAVPHQDVLPGGVADGSSPTPLDVNELAMGIKVELEHTNDPKIAAEIALDHIRETPDYYSRLSTTGLSPEISTEPNQSNKSTPPMGGDSITAPTVSPCCQDKTLGISIPVMEDKSTTTYDQYRDIARRLIANLMKMSQKNPKNYSEAERNVTPSVVKSVLIGLGNSDPELSAVLTKVGQSAYKHKKVRVKPE